MCRVSEDHVFLVGTYAAETFYLRWFERHLPPSGVTVRPCAMQYTGLSLAGPRSRALLQSLVREDLSTAAFPLHVVPAHGGRHGAGVCRARLLHRRSGVRDLGDEDYQRALYDSLIKAGREHGLKLFGGRALNSCASRRASAPGRASTDRSTAPSRRVWAASSTSRRPDFIGRAAAAAEKEQAAARCGSSCFKVDATDADAIGDEPIWHDGKAVGWVTSGAFGHRVGASLALGYVPAALAEADEGFEIEIIGERRRAVRLRDPAFDPSGALMRA